MYPAVLLLEKSMLLSSVSWTKLHVYLLQATNTPVRTAVTQTISQANPCWISQGSYQREQMLCLFK